MYFGWRRSPPSEWSRVRASSKLINITQPAPHAINLLLTIQHKLEVRAIAIQAERV